MPEKTVQELKIAAAKSNPVKTPQGYTLQDFNNLPNTSDVPAFIQQGIDMSKVKQVPAVATDDQEKQSVAWINSANPYSISVRQPDIYGPPILNHELTHTFQETRSPDLSKISAPAEWNSANPRAIYEYGGLEGLKKAALSRKTISDFNAEQQAEIVKDYKATQDKYLAKAKAGKATPADLRKMYEAHQLYHPLVRQLAAMPDAKVKLQPTALDMVFNRNIPSLDLKPEAPGLPSYDTPGLGVAPADPLLGGQSQAIPSTGSPKIGETKKFVNGKMGVWDGHGWRAK